MTTAECPECGSTIGFRDVDEGDRVQCPECGADLEVLNVDPLEVTLAPEMPEDWGQ
jgi:alpha-aminoadipate carrier protein LysW